MVGGPFPLFRSAKSAAEVWRVALGVACVAVVVAAGVGCPSGSSGKTAELRVAEAVHDFGGAETAWSLGVWSTGEDGKALGFTARADQPWVSVAPISGASTGPDDIATLALTVDRTKATNKAADGSYTGTLTISADGTDPVSVTLKARDPLPAIGLSETSHDFAAVGTEWSFTVWNAGEAGSTLNFAAAADSTWISVQPATGSSADVNHPVTVAVSIARGAMAKGQYAGAITISATGASPRTIPLTARDAVTALAVSDTTHDFGTTGAAWSFDVWNSGEAGSTLSFSVASNQTWLTANPAAGSSTGVGDKRTIAVAVARGALAAGNYSGNLTVSAAGVTPRIIAVTVRVPATAIAVSDTSHDFGFAETAWSFQVWNGGEAGSQLSFNVTSNKPWIQVSPAAGASASSTDKKTIAVTLVRDTLTRGAYSGAITVSNSSGATRTIAIAARAPEPAVVVSATSHDFGYLENAWAFEVWNGGETGSVLTFQATADKPWVSLTPVTGTSSGAQNKQSIAVHLDRSRLGAAQDTATITVAGAYVQPKTLTVQATPAVAPAANFTAVDRDLFAGESVAFADASTAGTAPITRWAWTFGDGGASAQQNPTHTYAAEGAYAVGLTVTSAHGTNTKTVAGFVTVAKKAAPKAGFAAASVDVPKGTPVAFVDQSQPGTASLRAWAWNFGDGATSAAQNPSHAYARTGQYDVQLTVTSDHGANTALKPKYITVKAQAPTAEFAASDVAPHIGQVVAFTDLSTPGTSPITAWTWNFGDGTGVSHAQNPTHTYTTAGIFTVSLTVTTLDGADTETKTDFIQVVVDPPVADFVGAPLELDTDRPVRFTDLSVAGSGDIVAWLWNFGDGGTSTQRNPSRQYQVYGRYTVTLTVTSSYNISSTQTYVDYVYVRPDALRVSFAISDNHPYIREIVQFTDLSDPGSVPVTGWLWDFGDGSQSTAQNPFHVYEQTGTFMVTLTVTTLGSQGSATQTLYVEIITADAEFSLDKTIVYTGIDNVTFIDQSTIDAPIIYAPSWEVVPNTLPDEPNYRGVGGVYERATATVRPMDGLWYYFHDRGLYTIHEIVWTSSLADPGDPYLPDPTSWYVGGITKQDVVEVREPSALDRYLRVETIEKIKGPNPLGEPVPPEEDLVDPYGYEEVAMIEGGDYRAYVLQLTSQRWYLDIDGSLPPLADPNDATWTHWLTIIVPNTYDDTRGTALLYVAGGEKGDPMPTEVNPDLAEFARVAGAVVAVVTQVPNQPISFTDEPRLLSEHQLLAYSFDKFMTTNALTARSTHTSDADGDMYWIGLFPMVKSVVRAMDAVQSFTGGGAPESPWPPLNVKDFVVTGAGTRGWATWLTATTDSRVRGIMPMAFDFLAVWTQIKAMGLDTPTSPYAEAWSAYNRPYPAGWDIFSRLTNPDDPTRPVDIGSSFWYREHRRMLEHYIRAMLYDLVRLERDDLAHVAQVIHFLHHIDLVLDYDLYGATGIPDILIIQQYMDSQSDYWTKPPAGVERNYAEDFSLWRVVGNTTPLYTGGAGTPPELPNTQFGNVVSAIRRLERNQLQSHRPGWLLHLIDPNQYNDKYNYIIGWHNEYGGRLRQPKYLLNSPGDAFFAPNSGMRYYPGLDGAKYLRFYPNTGRQLLGEEQTVLTAVPWFVRMAQGINPEPPYTWIRYNEGSMEARVLPHESALTLSEVNLWLAEDPNNDFRLDDTFRPDGPAWRKTPLAEYQAGTGKYFVSVGRDQFNYQAYFIEFVFDDAASGYPVVYTTEVDIVTPTCPGCIVEPAANFTATPLAPRVNDVVTFTDASASGSSPILTWLWDFGDGTAGSSAQNPTHTYTATGAYTVTLTVTTADGTDTRVKAAYINVHS